MYTDYNYQPNSEDLADWQAHLAAIEETEMSNPIQYEVINLMTNESHGKYGTLDEARGCINHDKLRYWQIVYNESLDEYIAVTQEEESKDDIS